MNKVIDQIRQALKTPDIRKKILFTLAMLVAFRVLAAIPLPGINGEAFKEFFKDNPFGSVFTLVTGGRLDNPSVVAIGLASYINASVILQLLTTVIPALEELQKEGNRGRQLINQYTRYLTVPLTILQAFVIYQTLKLSFPELIGEPSVLEVVTMIASLTAGTVVLMWISELISEMGVSNGSSFIIFAGILASLPGLIQSDLLSEGTSLNTQLLFIGGALVMIAGIVFVSEAQRRVPIQYARRVRGNKMYGGQDSYLPLKINQAGVMPVIFAASLLTFPQIIAQLLIRAADASSKLFEWSNWLLSNFYGSSNQWLYNVLYFLAIVGFAFFYTFVTFNPNETAENLKKNGGFIPGVRPGDETAAYLTNVMIKLTVMGAVFLAVVAIIPSLARKEVQFAVLAGIGGTSLLIVVGVILDTMRQLRSMMVTRGYEVYR